MKKIAHLFTAAAVAAAMAAPAMAADATNDAPAALTTPSLFQWKAMAAAEADALAKQLGKDTGPWLVKADSHDSRFSRSFTKMLSSELAARGVKLTTREDTKSVIDLQVERNPLQAANEYKPGTLTLITAGLWLVKGLTEITTPAGVATALAVGTDVVLSQQHNADGPAAELAVNLVAASNGNVAASTTNLYVLSGQGQGAYVDLPGKTLKFSK